VPLADALDGLFEVLPLLFEIGSQGLIERSGGVLSVTLCILFQLRSPFRFERKGSHKQIQLPD
jgi:hypothetical protein